MVESQLDEMTLESPTEVRSVVRFALALNHHGVRIRGFVAIFVPKHCRFHTCLISPFPLHADYNDGCKPLISNVIV